MVKVTSDTLSSMKIAKVFKNNKKVVNSIDYSAQGELLITSSEDESINIYDCQSGKHVKTLYSKKYGCDLLRFTHSRKAAIHASTKLDNKIRYLSLHDNKYLRYFQGHTDVVTSLCQCPQNDTFISCSRDNTFIAWDLRSPSPQALLHTNQECICAYDTEGLVVAIGIGSRTLKLYDPTCYDKGAFETWVVSHPEFSGEWSHIEFSADGERIVISTTSNFIFVIHAFKGDVLYVFRDFSNQLGLRMVSSITPDGEFLVGGSDNGQLHIWSLKTGGKVVIREGHAENPVQNVGFNPRKMMCASTCSTVAMWIPDE